MWEEEEEEEEEDEEEEEREEGWEGKGEEMKPLLLPRKGEGKGGGESEREGRICQRLVTVSPCRRSLILSVRTS